MRNVSLQDLSEKIRQRRSETEKQLLRLRERTHHHEKNSIRRRPRSIEERRILDRICKRKWEKAVREGKIKKIGEREYYYAVD